MSEASHDREAQDHFEFNVVSSRLAAQLERVDKIDSKIASVTAATIAVIGVLLGTAKTDVDYHSAVALLVPLVVGGIAYFSRPWDDAPKPGYFSEYYEDMPRETKRAAITRMNQAYETNTPRIRSKSFWADVTLVASILATVGVMLIKAIEPHS